MSYTPLRPTIKINHILSRIDKMILIRPAIKNIEVNKKDWDLLMAHIPSFKRHDYLESIPYSGVLIKQLKELS